MQMLVNHRQFEDQLTQDRRETDQPRNRQIGRVVSCTGARATISTIADDVAGASADFWAVGKLISINLAVSRIVGLVYELAASTSTWAEDQPNAMFVKVELLGEVLDGPDGKVTFRRGIARYPHLGAVAHRIRTRDLAAVYDISNRGGVEIGRLSQDDSIPAAVSIDDMLKRHFAVVGTTGVGKSSATTLLLRKAVEVKPDLRVLILDPHNEFARAFPDNSIIVEANSLELPFWMFRFEEFVDVVFRGRTVFEEEDILRDLIAAAKVKFRTGPAATPSGLSALRRPADSALNITADTPIPYRMADLFGLIEDAIGKLEPRHNRYQLRSLKARLEALCNDPRYKFMFGRSANEDSIDRVISHIFRIPHHGRPITVFQLAGLPSDVLNAVASVLARLAFDLAMLSDGAYEILLVCEEAHRYVPLDQSLGFLPTRHAIAKIAKEGRKYGAYLGVITQRPGELDPTILSQCSTVFAMRLGNDRDQEIIRSAIAESSASTIGFLSSIGNQEAIAFGEGIATPMRMKFAHQPRHHLPGAGQAEPLAGPAPEANVREIIYRLRGLNGDQRQAAPLVGVY